MHVMNFSSPCHSTLTAPCHRLQRDIILYPLPKEDGSPLSIIKFRAKLRKVWLEDWVLSAPPRRLASSPFVHCRAPHSASSRSTCTSALACPSMPRLLPRSSTASVFLIPNTHTSITCQPPNQPSPQPRIWDNTRLRDADEVSDVSSSDTLVVYEIVPLLPPPVPPRHTKAALPRRAAPSFTANSSFKWTDGSECRDLLQWGSARYLTPPLLPQRPQRA